AIAPKTARIAAHGPQFEYGNSRFGFATSPPTRLASMARAVSQVSRSTRTRLTILRRLLLLVAFLVVAAIALAQFTSLGRLAAGIFASTAVLGLIIGFAAQNTIANVIAGILIAGYSSKAFQAMGDPYLLPSIAAVVIGGTNILGGSGKLSGTVMGTILIVLLQSVLSVMQMPEAGRQIIYGIVIIAMLLAYGRGSRLRL
ncbi:MAG: hypothetical protein J0H63_12640, partial [Rhizobiales bacterium]|nr:hypothetical protein [Hyphomicrobiales bacterium]